MMDSAHPWQSTLHGVLSHPSEPRILLLPGAFGWSLPRTQLAERVWAPDAPVRLTEALRRELGMVLTVLRAADVCVDEGARRVDVVYTLESHRLAALPAGGRWIHRAGLRELPLALPEQRAVLEACLTEAEGGAVPAARPPWARRGWFGQAAAWIEAQLRGLGAAPLAPAEQVKTWGISAVLRARAATGDFYFKEAAKLPLFADEPVLTQALAARYPDLVPAPLAIDADRGWMLLPDVGRPLAETADIAMMEATLRKWGRVQRASARDVEVLLASGCLDRRLDILAGQIDPLLADAEAHPAISAAMAAELRRQAPRFKALCRKLAAIGLPATLVHGDLHWGNIAVSQGKTILFDWTDGCVAHPFLDLATLLPDTGMPGDRSDMRERLRDAYLEVWADDATPRQLRRAMDLAGVLGALHQAVSHQHIIPFLEATSRHELASGFSTWLLATLPALARVDGGTAL